MKVEKKCSLGDATRPNHRPLAPASFWKVPSTASTTAFPARRKRRARTWPRRRGLSAEGPRGENDQAATVEKHDPLERKDAAGSPARGFSGAHGRDGEKIRAASRQPGSRNSRAPSSWRRGDPWPATRPAEW